MRKIQEGAQTPYFAQSKCARLAVFQRKRRTGRNLLETNCNMPAICMFNSNIFGTNVNIESSVKHESTKEDKYNCSARKNISLAECYRAFSPSKHQYSTSYKGITTTRAISKKNRVLVKQ